MSPGTSSRLENDIKNMGPSGGRVAELLFSLFGWQASEEDKMAALYRGPRNEGALPFAVLCSVP
jgi:hypothetical protein